MLIVFSDLIYKYINILEDSYKDDKEINIDYISPKSIIFFALYYILNIISFRREYLILYCLINSLS